jgi:hypothetical protein
MFTLELLTLLCAEPMRRTDLTSTLTPLLLVDTAEMLPPPQAFQKNKGKPSSQISTCERVYSLQAVWPAEKVGRNVNTVLNHFRIASTSLHGVTEYYGDRFQI